MVTAAQLAEALPTIRTSLSKFAKDKDALDELVQNASLKIWANRAKCCYEQSSLILKWMLLVAKRTALRVYRDATSKARFCADAPIQYMNAAAPSGSPEDRIQATRALKAALDMNADYWRGVIYGKSCSDISAELGVPGGTVRAGIWRQRESLRERFEQPQYA